MFSIPRPVMTDVIPLSHDQLSCFSQLEEFNLYGSVSCQLDPVLSSCAGQLEDIKDQFEVVTVEGEQDRQRRSHKFCYVFKSDG